MSKIKLVEEKKKVSRHTVYRFTRDNKLRQFCFHSLHSTVVTKRELKLFRIVDSDKINVYIAVMLIQ